MEPSFTKCCTILFDTGGESSPRTNNASTSETRRSKNEGTPRTGETEGSHRHESRVISPSGAVAWIRVPGCPDSSLHAANVLGTVVGCDGTHLFLCHVYVFHGRLRVLPKNIERALVRGVLPEPVQREAEAVDEDSGV